MQIEVKGRNVPVTDELREKIARRFDKVSKQVSASAVLQVELAQERNPSNPICEVVEATLHIKGVTLRARERKRDVVQAVNCVADDISRQVKRHRDKRRGPRAGEAFAQPAAM